jgi:hypothetical protein
VRFPTYNNPYLDNPALLGTFDFTLPQTPVKFFLYQKPIPKLVKLPSKTIPIRKV